MSTRRGFFQQAGAALGGSWLAGQLSAAGGGPAPGGTPPKTGSDVGSLFPFIQGQAARGDFALSFLRDDFKDLAAWKRQARGKLLELLHYSPARCDPRPEVLERADLGDHVR